MFTPVADVLMPITGGYVVGAGFTSDVVLSPKRTRTLLTGVNRGESDVAGAVKLGSGVRTATSSAAVGVDLTQLMDTSGHTPKSWNESTYEPGALVNWSKLPSMNCE